MNLAITIQFCLPLGTKSSRNRKVNWRSIHIGSLAPFLSAFTSQLSTKLLNKLRFCSLCSVIVSHYAKENENKFAMWAKLSQQWLLVSYRTQTIVSCVKVQVCLTHPSSSAFSINDFINFHIMSPDFCLCIRHNYHSDYRSLPNCRCNSWWTHFLVWLRLCSTLGNVGIRFGHGRIINRSAASIFVHCLNHPPRVRQCYRKC